MSGPRFGDWQSGDPSVIESKRIEPPAVSRSGALDIAIDDFWPGRAVTLTQWEIDQYALRLRFEVRPPLAGRSRLRQVSSLVATDDLGNEYLSLGGATGMSPDGNFSDGVESLQLPARTASYVDLLVERDGIRRRVGRIDFSDGKGS